jgi:hypothetical protein
MHGIARYFPCRQAEPSRRSPLTARPSDIWFRKQTGYWYTTIDGRQHKLDTDEKRSRTMQQQLLRKANGLTEPGMSFASLADKFLDYSQRMQLGQEAEDRTLRTLLGPMLRPSKSCNAL